MSAGNAMNDTDDLVALFRCYVKAAEACRPRVDARKTGQDAYDAWYAAALELEREGEIDFGYDPDEDYYEEPP